MYTGHRVNLALTSSSLPLLVRPAAAASSNSLNDVTAEDDEDDCNSSSFLSIRLPWQPTTPPASVSDCRTTQPLLRFARAAPFTDDPVSVSAVDDVVASRPEVTSQASPDCTGRTSSLVGHSTSASCNVQKS